MKKTTAIRRGEEGYTILVVIFMLALFTLALSVAMPVVIKSLQRDRDIETFHRGKQYERAIKLYYGQFHAYPPNMEALDKTNNIRFLRKRYKDPTTGQEDWKLIHFGEAKTKPLGFFGKPIEGAGTAGSSVMSGVGPGGNNQQPGGLFSGSSPGNTGSNSPTDGSQQNSSTGSSPSSGFGGQTFGGLGIIGISPNSDKHSVLTYKQKDHYNEWEFVYDPVVEMYERSLGNAMQSGSSTGNAFDNMKSNPTTSQGQGATSPTPPSTTPPNSQF